MARHASRRFIALLAIPALLALPAQAAAPLPDRAALAAQAAKRFPQPVRVGDLIGRDVLEPIEAQDVLGRVDAVVKRPDGTLDLVMRAGGVLGLDTRLVAIPLDAFALLGEHVALLGLAPDQLGTLPTIAPPAGTLPPTAVVAMALVRPFH